MVPAKVLSLDSKNNLTWFLNLTPGDVNHSSAKRAPVLSKTREKSDRESSIEKPRVFAAYTWILLLASLLLYKNVFAGWREILIARQNILWWDLGIYIAIYKNAFISQSNLSILDVSSEND